MKIAHTPAIDIAYVEAGPSDGTPVLFLHGFPDDPHTWDGVWRELSGEPLRLIAPCLRGTGETRILRDDAFGAQPAALGQDVLDFADALSLPHYSLVGQDWGCRATYAAAALAPQRTCGILTIATPYVPFRGERQSFMQARAYWYLWYLQTKEGEEAMRENARDLCAYLWKVWSPKWHFKQQDFEAVADSWKNPQFADCVLHYYRYRLGNAPAAPYYAAQQEYLDTRPKIEAPTHFACGLADACNLPESSLGQEDWFTGGYERHEFPGVGHFVHREVPKAVSSLVQRLVTQGLS